MRYDWSRVSRQALENLAACAHAEQRSIVAQGVSLGGIDAALEQVRAEAGPPRSQEDVDGEIASIVRRYWSEEQLNALPLDRLRALCAEPVADAHCAECNDPNYVQPSPRALEQLEAGIESAKTGEPVFRQEFQRPGEVKETRIQGQVALSPRELLAQPVTETPEALQLLLKSVFAHRMTEGVQWHPGLAPRLVQVKAWDAATFAEVVRWVRLEHALAHPIAGLDYPDRDPVPRAVADAVDANERLERELKDKPQKPKRQRQKKASAK